jgi:hypothetical protein
MSTIRERRGNGDGFEIRPFETAIIHAHRGQRAALQGGRKTLPPSNDRHRADGDQREKQEFPLGRGSEGALLRAQKSPDLPG